MSNENLFDSLTRLAASGLPRRRMIKLSLGSLAAAAFGRQALATPSCPPPKVSDAGGNCCSASKIDAAGYCCPTGKALDHDGNCCAADEIDVYGNCCNASDGRHLDPAGHCCSSFDSFGYCKNIAACVGATCATYTECFDESACFCGATYQGIGICQVSVSCAPLATCPTGICPEGYFCLVNSCCGGPVCVPDSAECSPGAAAAVRANAAGGLTTGGSRF